MIYLNFARHCVIVPIWLFQTQRAKVVLPFLSLRKQLTFRDVTTAFPAKWHPRNERRNSILMTCHYSDLASAQSEAISSDASSLAASRNVGCFPATWFSVEKNVSTLDSQLELFFLTLRASLFSPSFRAQAIFPAYDTSSGKRHNSNAVPINAEVIK